ncbi:MAG: MCE family protein [SAR324 cluster bacterium]|nr:MCE family protein [SAR324 cluster bacterium]
MTPKSKNILVGIFVVCFSIGAISLITWLGSTAIQEETLTYVSYLDEAVSGLSENSPVKYKGVNIGQVEKIQINPNNSNQIELRLLIKQGTPIKIDSQLILTAQGITGLQYVEITGGTEGLPLLVKKQGQKYPVISAGQSTLATVQAAIGPILNNINLTIDDIRKILKTTNTENVADILSDIQKVTGAFANNADGIFKDINQTSSGLQQVIQSTATLNRLMLSIEKENIIPKLGETISHVNRSLDQMEQERVFVNVGKTAARVDNMVESIEGQLSPLLEEFHQSSRALNGLLTQMEQQNTAKEIYTTLQEIQRTTRALHQVAEESDVASVMEKLAVTMEEIQTFAQTWREVAETMENQPSALIFGDSKQEIKVVP